MLENTGLTVEMLEAAGEFESNPEKKRYLAVLLGCSVTTIENRFNKAGYEWIKINHSTDISKTMKAYRKGPCQVCGENRETDRAHIVSNSDMGASSEDNTVFLCPTHHRLYDAGKLTEAESLELEYFFSTHIGSTRAVGTSQRKRWVAQRYSDAS